MKPTRPPRWAERVLEASGADAEFQDAVLGDLTEEYVIRAAYDGARHARRWYVREALRTLPHLLRDWRSRLRWSDARYLAGVIGQAYAAVAVCTLPLVGLMMGTLAALGINLGTDFPASNELLHRLGVPGTFTLATISAVIGGYIAARIGRRAPLASAMGLGLFWCTLAAVAWAALTVAGVGAHTPAWWTVVEAMLVIAGTTTGGILHAATVETDRRTAGS